jgi:hypothetical protein
MQIVTNLVNKDRDWDETLGFAFSGYNATIHETTGFTPNMLWHGRELRNTVGNLVPSTSDASTSYTDYAKKLRDKIQIAHDVTRNALRRGALKSKRLYDRRMHFVRHRAGDQVMLRDHTKVEKGTKKFKQTYVGPFWVIDRLGDVVYRIQENEHTPAKVVHHNLLRRYHNRVTPVFVPLWVRQKSRYLQKLEYGSTIPENIDQPRVRRLKDTWVERRQKLRRSQKKRATLNRSRSTRSTTDRTKKKSRRNENIDIPQESENNQENRVTEYIEPGDGVDDCRRPEEVDESRRSDDVEPSRSTENIKKRRRIENTDADRYGIENIELPESRSKRRRIFKHTKVDDRPGVPQKRPSPGIGIINDADSEEAALHLRNVRDVAVECKNPFDTDRVLTLRRAPIELKRPPT